MFKAVDYSVLNSRQKENFNFHKMAARLADYGFNCMRLSDDWQGADFIAYHIDGNTFLKVQLKGRLVIDRKYENKEIHIGFIHNEEMFVYNHDCLIEFIEAQGLIGADSKKWHEKGFRHWPSPPKWAHNFLEQYKL